MTCASDLRNEAASGVAMLTVTATGPGADDLAGKRVIAFVRGGYAEYAIAPCGLIAELPPGIDLAEATAYLVQGVTAWQLLRDCAGIAPGESVLVHSAAGGVGTLAVQLAKAFGARVYVTAGSAEKCDACVRLGADGAINYREADFAESIRQFTAGQGVDVVLDMVGAPYMARNLRCLALDGRLVLIAFLGGPKAEALDFTTVMTRRLTITGSTMRPRTAAQKAAIAAELREKVWPLLNAGQCKPLIHAAFPLERAADAHRLMESSAHVGKIMLTVAD